MADESMVRNLDAQARAIWPRKCRSSAATGSARTSAFSTRVAVRARSRPGSPTCSRSRAVLGVDISTIISTARVRVRVAGAATRVRAPEHLRIEGRGRGVRFHRVPARRPVGAHVERVLGELKRVTKPGGWCT